MPEETRSLFWEDNQLCLLDQRELPHRVIIRRYTSHEEVAKAIKDMVVRGAPAIGAAAAYGLLLSARQSTASSVEALRADLKIATAVLADSRPTAVNLFWALERLSQVVECSDNRVVEQIRAAVENEAHRIAREDIEINQRIGAYGAELVPERATILHHCNTGSLATVGWGTALGVIRSAYQQGKKLHVLVDETRPRLQGARLTSWELRNEGIEHTIIVDGASGHYMRRKGADLCLVGADRIAANGDTANKIGTYNLAVLAHENGVPFYVAAPTSTIDPNLGHGDDIEIEERPEEEVTWVEGCRIAPEGVHAGNPAFDVTPNRYITGIITEFGVITPPFEGKLVQTVEKWLELRRNQSGKGSI